MQRHSLVVVIMTVVMLLVACIAPQPTAVSDSAVNNVALVEFEASQQLEPKRLRAFYQQLVALTATAEGERVEVALATEFLAQ